MLVKVSDLNKTIGTKELFEDLDFVINEGEKVALIGRNGLGKTSLFKIISGEDTEFSGNLEVKKNTKIILTKQEHFLDESLTALEYIFKEIPKYLELQKVISDYETFGEEKVSLQKYCDVLQEFTEEGFFELKSRVIQSLADFQLNQDKLENSLINLSGGEKRFVELVRIMYSGADLALIDEPTNHMDYVGKEKFIKWLNTTKQTVFVVTHDRDVLHNVDKIFELKDKQIIPFTGNYDNYIEQNSLKTVTSITQYELDSKRLDKAYKQMIAAKIRKMEAKSDDGRLRAKVLEDRFRREYEKLKENLSKPSFWIDKESLGEVSEKVTAKYHKYKEKNINISHSSTKEHKKLLVSAKKLALGYNEPLFIDINFNLYHGDKIFIKGRNGAGKSTLVKKIISEYKNTILQSCHPELVSGSPGSKHEVINKTASFNQSQIFEGQIKLASTLKIGVYEQEINPNFLELTLNQAVIEVYKEKDIPINSQKLRNILINYLFDSETDGVLKMEKLSGGQKARFQLIKMFADNPNLLILDEPTNHLDLPSIEELENALQNYHGGIIYISHDSYFVKNLGGEVVEIA